MSAHTSFVRRTDCRHGLDETRDISDEVRRVRAAVGVQSRLIDVPLPRRAAGEGTRVMPPLVRAVAPVPAPHRAEPAKPRWRVLGDALRALRGAR